MSVWLAILIIRVIVLVSPDAHDVVAWAKEENVSVATSACEWGDNWLRELGLPDESADHVRRAVCEGLRFW